MNPIKATYYTTTILFGTFMIIDGMAGLFRVQAGQDIMQHLGYPVYILSILGTAKILGAVGILQNKFRL